MKVRLLMFALVASATLAAAPTTAHAQKATARKPIETRSAQSRGTGSDQNIKSEEETNTKGVTIPAPPGKGGAKTRGAAVGQLRVDNRTSWRMRIFVDGTYVGTIAPWGGWYTSGGCDAYSLYADARFTDGSRRTWGPATTNNGCGNQTWTIRP